jgi:outer membrane protein assembly factor BamA/autotransporter translocation and assembly factor TamB
MQIPYTLHFGSTAVFNSVQCRGLERLLHRSGDVARAYRRTLRRLTIAFVALCLVAIILFFTIHTRPVRRYAVNKVMALLAQKHIEFHTDELNYNLLKASLDLKNIRVRSVDVPDAPVFATIKRAQINLSLPDLLRGRYVVESGSVDGVDVHYFVDEQGRDNLPRPLTDPNKPNEPLNYLISALKVSNVRLRYENRAQQIDAELPVSLADVSGNRLTDRQHVMLTAGMGRVRVKDRTTPIDRLLGEIEWDDKEVKVAKVDVDSEGSRAELADVVYDQTQRRANVSSLTLRGTWGDIVGSGVVALDAANRSQVQADINSVDAEWVMRTLDLPYTVASRVSGKVRAEWPGLEYRQATGDADATLTPTTTRVARSTMPVGGRVIAKAANGRIDAQLLQVSAAGAQASGRVALTEDRRLTGQITGRASDVSRVTSSLEAFLGRARGSLMPTPVTGSLAVDTRVSGTLDEPTAAAKVTAPALSVGGATGVALAADLVYTPAALNVQRADLTWEEAKAHVDGRVGLAGDRRLSLNLTANDVGVPWLLKVANQSDVPASGVLSAMGTVGGTTARPQAMVNVQGAKLVAYGEEFGSLNADVNLTGREVQVSRFTIEKPQPDTPGLITGTGSYHLDRRTYTADLRSENLKLLGLQLPSGETIRGDMQLAAKGMGSVDAPAGAADVTFDGLEVERPPSQGSGAAGPPSPESPGGEAAEVTQVGRVVVNAVAENKQATIKATAERFNVNADALVTLARPWATKLTVRAENLDVATLPGLPANGTYEGQLRATVEASGDLVAPEKGMATATIESFMGAWNGRPFTIMSSAPLQYADERLTIEGLEVDASGSTLTVKGELPLTDRAGEGELAVDLRGNIGTLTQYLPPDTPVAGDGELTLTGTLKGTLKAIDPDLALTIKNGLVLSRYLEPGFSNLQLQAKVADGQATIENLTGNWGAATFEASGRIPLEVVPPLPVEIPRMGGPSTFKAAVRGLNPAAIPGAPQTLSGAVSIQADLSATRPDLAALNGTISFPELALAFRALELGQKEVSTIAIASGVATIQRLELTGSAGTIAAKGTVGLTGDRALDVNVDGMLNAGAISVVTDRVRAEGDTTVQLQARGTVQDPNLMGTVTLRDGTAVSDEPNIAAENINADIALEGNTITLTSLKGDVNGGTLEGSGSLTLGEGGIADIDMRVATKDFAYDAPLDLRSLSDADIRISKQDDDFLVSGRVTITEGGLTGDINFDTGLLAAMTARRKLDLTEERDTFIERVRFDVNVNTSTPILVDNNLARAEARSRLRLVGTPYEPGLVGQVTLLEGGEIRLNERRYEVDRGIITFVDERRIFPSFDLQLHTTASNYDITIGVTGTPGDTQTTLTSDPTLPEPDIMAMLVTGRTLDEMRGEEYEVAREQVLSYMTGRVGSSLGRGLQRATGLSEVRIEPTVIANEADPSARLTVGQDLTDQLKLVYSTNLTDSNDQIWVAEYDVTRRFKARGVRQSDATFRFDFQHDVRFGGQASPRRQLRVRPTVAQVVAVSADTGEDDPEVREEFDVKEGHHFDFFVIRDETKEVEEALMKQGFLQSRIRLERRIEADQAYLTLRVKRGPRVEIRFDGATPPKSVQELVRTKWHRGVFDKQRQDDGAEVLREWLMTDGYLQPKVEYKLTSDSADHREIVYTIQTGSHYDKVVVAFEGASGVDPDELDKIINQQKLERDLFTDPLVVTELLARYYRDQGYLAAAIDEPHIEYQGSIARVVLPVREGPKFMVRRVAMQGNKVWGTEALLQQLPVMEGEPFMPFAAENALDKIRTLYWPLGYNDIRSDYSMVLDRGIGVVDVTFTIKEGAQSIVGPIQVRGTQRLDERLVRRQIELEPGQPLDLSALAKSRRNLYDTGAFSTVQINQGDRREENRRAGADAGAGGPQTSEQSAPAQPSEPIAQAENQPPNGQKPVPLNVVVREVQPLQLRYGASYDTERGVGGIFNISQHNWLGGARVIGLQSRYDRQLKDGRIFITQPALRYLPFQTTGTIYFHEDLSPPSELTRAFTANRKGASIQQEVKLLDSYVWSWGYRWERAHTLEPVAGVLIGEPQTVSPLTSTLTRETRDEALDASRGSFQSQSMSFSPRWLGSDIAYLKYFGQYFHYFPLRPPQRKPLTNEYLRPRLVFATGVRVGLAKGIGGEVPNTEQFFAGGSYSMRGFAQNAVGPIGPDLIPSGGNALVIFNNELRAPLFGRFDGVIFTDIGNVYPLISDITFDFRESAGVGLRVRTPWFLLRGDYGFVLDPRPGEKRQRFYFSIGQAF